MKITINDEFFYELQVDLIVAHGKIFHDNLHRIYTEYSTKIVFLKIHKKIMLNIIMIHPPISLCYTSVYEVALFRCVNLAHNNYFRHGFSLMNWAVKCLCNFTKPKQNGFYKRAIQDVIIIEEYPNDKPLSSIYYQEKQIQNARYILSALKTVNMIRQS